MSESTTYLTVAEAQAYLRFPSPSAFRVWARRHGIPKCRRGGRVLLFLRRDLDEAVQSLGHRHKQTSTGQQLGAVSRVHAGRMRENDSAEQRNSIAGPR